jgi:phosphoribosylanthranilate isomerase
MDRLVKICGITNLDDALVAAQSGADLLGYIFYEKSPRYVPLEQVESIVQQVRAANPLVRHVGVFVSAPVEHVAHVVQSARLDLAQLHGSEDEAYCRALGAMNIQWMKALRFGKGAPAAQWQEYEAGAYLLCDTYDPAEAGGTGRPFDHALLPVDLPRERVLLAGGLTPENVAQAVLEVGPGGVDVSSGVEAVPGRKDHEKVRGFIRQAKGR